MYVSLSKERKTKTFEKKNAQPINANDVSSELIL